MLFNEQATLGNLYKELEWMVGNSQEGDKTAALDFLEKVLDNYYLEGGHFKRTVV